MANEGRPLVLSVDDDAGSLYARNRILRNAGYDVIDAANGRQALALLARKPDVVILDVGLPDIDGFQVCRAIKANPETSSISVLQVSASFVKGSDRTRALEGGADNFIVEPVEPEVLVATVNSLLRIRRAEEAARQAAEEWVATFDAISEGVALVDEGTRVQRCNQAFARVLNTPVAELVTRSWPELLAAAVSEERRIDTSSLGTGEPRASYCIAGRWLQVGTIALGGSRAVVVLTDVTDHMRALKAAEDTNRLKDEFLAVLSHELRTPLNAIVGWAQLLQMGQLGAPETAKALQIINRNAQSQNQIISDILDVSSIIAGKLRLEVQEMDLRDVVDAALDTVKPSALAKGVRIHAALDAVAGAMDGDPGRLQQVAWNILSNAIKYAPPNGNVRVRLTAAGADVLLIVEDDGPGVKPEFLPYVFDRFRQADSSSSRPKGGLGLGLAIVKHIVDLHGGSVAVENARPEVTGAVFTVRLPRASRSISAPAGTRAVEVPAAGMAPTGPRLAGVRVLVVDDEADARDLVCTVLQGAGADVLTAAAAVEALPILERDRPDVLVCDIEMAGEDGLDFVRRLRTIPKDRGGATPAVALTAYARPEDAVAALGAGFQMHLAKPVKPAELMRVVEMLARGR
jgi:signal transduction histidine kinase